VEVPEEGEWPGFFGGIDDKEAGVAVTGERAFPGEMGGGCRASVGALGECSRDGEESRSLTDLRGEGGLRLWGRVSAPDGSRQVDAQMGGSPGEAGQLGRDLAQQVLRRGAKEIIKQINEVEVRPDENRQR